MACVRERRVEVKQGAQQKAKSNLAREFEAANRRARLQAQQTDKMQAMLQREADREERLANRREEQLDDISVRAARQELKQKEVCTEASRITEEWCQLRAARVQASEELAESIRIEKRFIQEMRAGAGTEIERALDAMRQEVSGQRLDGSCDDTALRLRIEELVNSVTAAVK